MRTYPTRCLRLVFGLFLFALGIVGTIQAEVGLTPWEALTIGLCYHTGLSYGTISILTGIVIVVADYLLGEKFGFGTIINIILIGLFVDLIRWMEAVPAMESFPAGIVMLLAGQFSVCVGSYFYIGAAMGCGPRDALMVALGRRLPRVPIGMVRGTIEGSVLLLGWLLGAKVGIGTVIAVLGISFIMQWTFRVLRFDVKGVVHESCADTITILRG